MVKYKKISFLLVTSLFINTMLFALSEDDARAAIKRQQAAGFRSELRSVCTKTGCVIAAAACSAYFIPGMGTMGGLGLLYLTKDQMNNLASCYGLSEESENMRRAKKLNVLEERFAVLKGKMLDFNIKDLERLVAQAREYLGYGLKQVYEYETKQADYLIAKIETILELPLHPRKSLSESDFEESIKELNEHLSTYSESVHDNIIKAAIKINNLSKNSGKGAAKASFWFVGEAGVGKTETAEMLARALKRPFCKINLAITPVDDLLGQASLGVGEAREKIGQIGALARCFLRPDIGESSLNPIIFIDEVHDVLNGKDANAKKLYSLLKFLTEGREHEISENGLGVKLDLSRVVFIFGANASILDDEAGALATRINTIQFDLLTKEQKSKIAITHFERLAQLHGYFSHDSEGDCNMMEAIIARDASPGARVLINVIEEYIIHQQACAINALSCREFDIPAKIRSFGGIVED